jgi:hypothetical protein
MPLIQTIRSGMGLTSITTYVTIEISELPKYQYVDMVKKNRENYWPTRDDRVCAESYILVISKVDMILQTMDKNPFNTTKFGWIDSNLGKANLSKVCENYENNMLLYILNNITDKFHIQLLNVCDKKYKESSNRRRMYDKYRWIACGCLFTMSKEIGKRIISRINDIAVETIMSGYGHSEEQLFLEILDEFYDDIHRSYGDYYNILNNFIRPTRGFQYIDNYIIKNYQNKRYYRECYDCCKIVLEQYDSYRVKIDYTVYFSIFISYYIATYYYKGKDEALQLVNKIMASINTNPFMKQEYDKNKYFYEEIFSHCYT